MSQPVPPPSPLRQVGRLIFWVILPLLAGLLLAWAIVPVPQIGLIRFDYVIWSDTAGYINSLIDHVQHDARIRAVVLIVDSPGGGVTPTEEIYFRLLELRKTRPLVIAIDSMAASGGYYMAAAGDYVLAKPSSIVGNIGVISSLPSVDEQRFTDESYISTGPFKFSGGSRGDFMRQIELLKLGFLEAVFAQRGDKLQADRQALSSGEVFLGLQAQQLGLVDALGATNEAVQKAANLAHIAHYKVVDVDKLVYGEAGWQPEWWWQFDKADQVDALLRSSSSGANQPGLYYLYVEPQKRRP